MPILRFQVKVPAASLNTEDDVTNTWHFTATDTTEGILADIKAQLVLMYESIDTWKSNQQSWTGARVKVFDMDQPEPRVPISDTGLALTSAPSGSPLPPEICVCLSFHGEYISGASQARRRGRVFLGPLNLASLNSDGRFTTTLQSSLSTAAANFVLASNAASDWAWIVYSPSGDTGYPVVNGWTDNAPDIQRRRGVRSSFRWGFS